MKRVRRCPICTIRIIFIEILNFLIGFSFDAATAHRGTHEEIEEKHHQKHDCQADTQSYQPWKTPLCALTEFILFQIYFRQENEPKLNINKWFKNKAKRKTYFHFHQLVHELEPKYLPIPECIHQAQLPVVLVFFSSHKLAHHSHHDK